MICFLDPQGYINQNNTYFHLWSLDMNLELDIY